MHLCLHVHRNERVLSVYTYCVARLATGLLPRGSGSGVPVRVCGRGHAYDVYMGMDMGMDMPITMCLDRQVCVCVRMEACVCS